jgi:hypothetical protein
MKPNAISEKKVTQYFESGGAAGIALNSVAQAGQTGTTIGQAFDMLFGQLIENVRAVVQYELSQRQNTPATPEAAETEKLLTAQQTAVLLGICRQTVFDYAKRGLLIAHRLGGRTYFKQGEVLAALQSPEAPKGRKKAPKAAK